MKTIMAKNPHDSFSFSRRYFNWKKKGTDAEEEEKEEEEDNEFEEIFNFTSKSEERREKDKIFPMQQPGLNPGPAGKTSRKKIAVFAMARLRALTLGRARAPFSSGLGARVVGTLFGQRRGHVRFAFQDDFKQSPAFLVELATPTSVLVKEMASGLVRIALECEKRAEKKGPKLLEEPVWRTYCNGKKCGYAMRRECGPDEWKVLNAVGPISMGAGVLPGGGGGDSDGEMMYMRAKFERVVGSKDSEAFYMMNPDGNGGPELSLYLLRV